jgi:hypothetical protein
LGRNAWIVGIRANYCGIVPYHHFETVDVKMTDYNIDKKDKSANNAWL